MKLFISKSFYPFCTAVILSGCSTVPFPPYASHSPSTAPLLKHEAGLELLVDPVLATEGQKTYFGFDLVKQGVLPVFIRVTNTTAGQSVLLQKEGMTLTLGGSGGGSTSTTESARKSTGAATTVGVVGVVGTIFVTPLAAPLMIVAPMMAGRDHQMTQNLVDKEFYDNTVSPGASKEGFVYFQLPQQAKHVAAFTITFTATALTATNLTSDNKIHISYEHK